MYDIYDLDRSALAIISYSSPTYCMTYHTRKKRARQENQNIQYPQSDCRRRGGGAMEGHLEGQQYLVQLQALNIMRGVKRRSSFPATVENHDPRYVKSIFQTGHTVRQKTLKKSGKIPVFDIQYDTAVRYFTFQHYSIHPSKPSKKRRTTH